MAVVSMMCDCSIVGGDDTPFDTLKPERESELAITPAAAAEEPALFLETDPSKRDDRRCWSACGG